MKNKRLQIKNVANAYFCVVTTVSEGLLQCPLHCILYVEAGAGAVAMAATSSKMFQMTEQLERGNVC